MTMGCLGECWDVGPPPDSILNLPPPPIPSFLQHPLADLLANTTPCSVIQCESLVASNRVPESGDYMELPRKDLENWTVSAIDDTWLLVLVASSIGVLLLGALLAMFLLKCREMHMFDANACSMSRDHHRPMKVHQSEPRDCPVVTNLNTNKLMHHHPDIYHGNNLHDNRMVWAALTPHGTQHFIGENYPRDLIHYGGGENGDAHYETVDNVEGAAEKAQMGTKKASFDNTGFVDYDYEEPMPLIESYQLNDMELVKENPYAMLGNPDMRCANLAFGNSLRRATPRPRVSSPTRIEHPNLPPLNLYPHKSNTLNKRNNTLSYRHVDTAGTLPKYGC